MHSRNNTALLVVEPTTRRFISSKKISVSWFSPSECQPQNVTNEDANGHAAYMQPTPGTKFTAPYVQKIYPPCNAADDSPAPAHAAVPDASDNASMEGLLQLLQLNSIQDQTRHNNSGYKGIQSEAGAVLSNTSYHNEHVSLRHSCDIRY
jgi:hypothetical protein